MRKFLLYTILLLSGSFAFSQTVLSYDKIEYHVSDIGNISALNLPSDFCSSFYDYLVDFKLKDNAGVLIATKRMNLYEVLSDCETLDGGRIIFDLDSNDISPETTYKIYAYAKLKPALPTDCPVTELPSGIYQIDLTDINSNGWQGASLNVQINGENRSYSINRVATRNEMFVLEVYPSNSRTLFSFTGGSDDANIRIRVNYQSFDGTTFIPGIINDNDPTAGVYNLNICVPEDLDNDGVDDKVDQCDNSPNSDFVDSNGCSLSTLISEFDTFTTLPLPANETPGSIQGTGQIFRSYSSSGAFQFEGVEVGKIFTSFDNNSSEEAQISDYNEPGRNWNDDCTGCDYWYNGDNKYNKDANNDYPFELSISDINGDLFSGNILPAVTLTLLDENSNPVSGNILRGALTKNLESNGYVTFKNIEIVRPGTYKIRASVDNYPNIYYETQPFVARLPIEKYSPNSTWYALIQDNVTANFGGPITFDFKITQRVIPTNKTGSSDYIYAELIPYNSETTNSLYGITFGSGQTLSITKIPSGQGFNSVPYTASGNENDGFKVTYSPTYYYYHTTGQYKLGQHYINIDGLGNIFIVPNTESKFYLELPPSLEKSLLISNELEIPANGIDYSTVYVDILDEQEDPYPKSFAGGVTFEISSGTASMSSVTDYNDGTYSAQVSSTVAGLVQIKAKIGDDYILEDDGSNNPKILELSFTPGPVSLSNIELTSTKSILKPSESNFTYVQLILKDAFGNTVTESSSYTVTFRTNFGEIGPAFHEGNGIFSTKFSATNNTGQATIEAFVNGQLLDKELQIIITGSQGLLFKNKLEDIEAGEVFNPTVELIDGSGTKIADGSGIATIRLYDNSDPGLILSGTLTATIVNGEAIFSGLSINKAVNNIKLKVTSSNEDYEDGLSNSFSVAPLNLVSSSQVIFEERTIASDDSSIIPVTIQLYDSFNNSITDLSNNTIALSSSASYTIANPAISSTGIISSTITTNAISDTINLTLDIDSQSTTVSYTLKGVELCPGSSVVLESVNYDYEYKWFKNGVGIENGIERTITVSEEGVYKVITTNPKNCDSFVEDYIFVKILDDTAPVITSISGQNEFYYKVDQDGNPIDAFLTLTSSENKEAKWFKDGILISGQNSSTLVVSESGSYTSQYLLSSGCYSELSDPITITFSPLPVIIGPDYISDSQTVRYSSNNEPYTTNPWGVDISSGTNTVTISSDGIITDVASSTTEYTFEVNFTDINSNQVSKTVTYLAPPSITISGSTDITIINPTNPNNIFPSITICAGQPTFQLLGDGSPLTETFSQTTFITAWTVGSISEASVNTSTQTPSIAIDENGYVTVSGEGASRVTYTNSYNLTASIDIYVENPSIGIASSTNNSGFFSENGDIVVIAGQTIDLDYTISLGTATNTGTWSVVDPSIASISNDGQITGNLSGITSVQLQTENGYCGTSVNVIVDEFPTVDITLEREAITHSETTSITFTFSEAIDGFDASDVIIPQNIKLENLTKTTSTTFQANISATSNSITQTTILIPSFRYYNQNQIYNTETSSATLIIDSTPPNISITKQGGGTTLAGSTNTIVFTLTESSTTFDQSDISVSTSSGTSTGTLSNFTAVNSMTYTVSYLPPVSYTGTITFSVPSNTFSDLAGNTNTASSTIFDVDTLGPEVVSLTSSDNRINSLETSTLTITLTKSSTTFDQSDISVSTSGTSTGTLSSFTAVSSTTYSVVYTPPVSYVGSVTFSIASATFTDIPGNPNTQSST
ncbi:Ig-like domain-containing protein, partial [Flavobacteriaceae bacterium]|nr:Ig-like domain-containing protein [Flavobacteriaceae bacterium]